MKIHKTDIIPFNCGECGQETTHIIEIGVSPADYESKTAYVCRPCIEKALEAFKTNGPKTLADRMKDAGYMVIKLTDVYHKIVVKKNGRHFGVEESDNGFLVCKVEKDGSNLIFMQSEEVKSIKGVNRYIERSS